jgi:hypothetical protein
MRIAMLRRTLPFLLLLQSQAWAVCSSLGAGRWHCPDTGSPATNGVDLFNFLNTQPFACGDTIILYAGIEYLGPNTSSDPQFRLTHQNCAPGQMTQIISSALEEIPFNQKQNLPAYAAKMPSLSTRTGAVFHLYPQNRVTLVTGPTNGWALRGLRITTTQDAYDVSGSVVNLVFGTWVDYNQAANMRTLRTQDIEMDRVIVDGFEFGAYGEPNNSNKNGNAFLSSYNQGISGVFRNFHLHDSFIRATGYYRNTAWQTISAGAAGNPTKLTGTGLPAALGISYNASCTSGCEGWNVSGNCVGACTRVVIRNVGNGSDQWENLNGVRLVRARADGDLDVIQPHLDTDSFNTSNHNSTGWGPFTATGTPQLARAVPSNQQGVLLDHAWDFRIIDTHIEAWGVPIFLGGGSSPSIDPKTVQSGSTATSIILNDSNGLHVGMIFSVDVPGSTVSQYCTPTGACIQAPGNRVGRITAINGNTLTVEPWAQDGIDKAPTVGGQFRYKSWGNRGVEIRGSNLSRGYLHPNAGAGKGASENKSCTNCLIDGNVMGGYLDASNIPRSNVAGTYFTQQTNQSGLTPDHVLENIRYSHNIGFGQLPSGAISGMWHNNINFGDYVHSGGRGEEGVWFEHNVAIGVRTPPNVNGFSHIYFSGARKSNGYRHNTFAVDMGQTESYRFVYHSDCMRFLGQPYAWNGYTDYFGSQNVTVKDNIISYGDGAYLGATDAGPCWPTYQNDIKNNIVIDTESILGNQGALNALFPGNTYQPNYANFWEGPCAYDSWSNCRLKSDHPARGTASDGGDPGADIEAVQDRIHRWSERAGLLVSNLGAANMERNPSNWQTGSTRTGVRFVLYGSTGAACNVQLFTTRNRSALHADTNNAGRQACDRTSSLADGDTVTFVFGAESPLTPSTTYFYRITDGTRVMVGEFQTAPAGSDTARSVQLPAADSVSYSINPDLSGSTTLPAALTHSIPMASGSVVYWRVGAAGQRSLFVAP